MKIFAGLFALIFLASAAHGQGQIGPGHVLGNPSTVQRTPTDTSIPSLFDRALCSTTGAFPVRAAGGWQCSTAAGSPSLPTYTVYAGILPSTATASNWTLYGANGIQISTGSSTTQGMQEAINAALTGLGTSGADLIVRGGDESTGGARVVNSSGTINFPATQGKMVEFGAVTLGCNSGVGANPCIKFDSQEMAHYSFKGAQLTTQGTGYALLFAPTNGTPLDLGKTIVDTKFFATTVVGAVGFSFPAGSTGATNSSYEIVELNASVAGGMPDNAGFFVPAVAAGQNYAHNWISSPHIHDIPAGKTGLILGNGAPAGGQVFGRNFYFTSIIGAATANGIDTYESNSFYLATANLGSSGTPLRTRAGAINNIFIIPYQQGTAAANNVEGATGNILIGGGQISIGTIAPISTASLQVRPSLDHNLIVVPNQALADGASINSVNDANGAYKGLEFRGSTIQLTSNSVIVAALSAGSGIVQINGGTSGQLQITTQAIAGSPVWTAGTSSGTPAVTASLPLAIDTATGNISISSGVWSNTRLAKTAAYAAVSADCGSTIALGGAAFYTLTINAASGYAASCVLVIVNEDSVRAKTLAINGITSFLLYPLQSVTVFNDNSTWQLLPKAQRWKLLAATTVYVDGSNGSNSNDCLAVTTGACLTIQAALDYVAANFDLGGQTVTVSVASKTAAAAYTGGTLVTLSGPWTGAGEVKLTGDITTPSNVTLSCTSDCILMNGKSTILSIQGFKLTSSGGNGAYINTGATLNIIEKMDYGSAAAAHLQAVNQGAISIAPVGTVIGRNYTISGGAQQHWYSAIGGFISAVGIPTITVSGTPAFSVAFAKSEIGSQLRLNGNTYSGSATGSRFDVESNSVIFISAPVTALPGNAAGTTSTGGQYL